jgi:hypothetical protein
MATKPWAVPAVFALALVFASMTGTAFAGPLYQDYVSPANPYSGYMLAGPTALGTSRGWGFQFTPTVSGQVQSIDVALDSGAGPLAFQLYADDGTNHPGALLDTMPFTGSIPGLSIPMSFTNILSVSQPVLTAGDEYWLVGTASGSADMTWSGPAQGGVLGGNNVELVNGVPSYEVATQGDNAAFDIQGSAAVPEPGAVALIASCCLTGAIVRRRRSR